jgi:hypothetical protein
MPPLVAFFRFFGFIAQDTGELIFQGFKTCSDST